MKGVHDPWGQTLHHVDPDVIGQNLKLFLGREGVRAALRLATASLQVDEYGVLDVVLSGQLPLRGDVVHLFRGVQVNPDALTRGIRVRTASNNHFRLSVRPIFSMCVKIDT